MTQSEWDYVVVGGGTAGCVMAARLTESRDTSVLLLEAGGEYPRSALAVPLAGMRQITHYSWKYFTRQQPGLGGRRISYPFGKLLGGSSSTNAMLYCRGDSPVYDRWAEAGNPGWSFSGVLPYFRKSENQQHGPSEYHGAGGPVDVADLRHRAPFSQAFVEACLEAGMPYCEDFNGAHQEGAGFFQVTQQRGRRVTTAGAYLARVRRRNLLRVETNALVLRLMLEGLRAAGVEYVDRQGERRRARAAREVILCAGALNSPKILMLSGIGPAAHLSSLGIETSLDIPGVGANLQDHPRVPVLYESGRRSPGDMVYWIPAAAQYALRGKGVLASNCCESGALLRTAPDSDAGDLQFVTHFQSALYPGTVDLQFCVVRPLSRGSLTLSSDDPRVPPVIDPNYFSEPADIRVALEGVRLARKIAQAPALRRFPLAGEVMPGADLISDGDLEVYIRSTAESCYHPAGTCRMGCDTAAVVDAQLRVRGIDGLRVADASIMPELPNGNTSASTIMIAEKAADMIKGVMTPG